MYYNDYELMYLIKEDNEEALEIMVKKYEPVIDKLVRHYLLVFNNLKLEYEDLFQEGKLGLFKAIKSYQIEKELLFYSFALLCARRQILNYIRVMSSKKSFNLTKAISIEDNPILENITDYKHPLNKLFEDDFFIEIIKFKHSLKINDSLIFELKLNGFSYKEIGELLCISKKEVDNSLLKTRKVFKKYLYSCNNFVL